MKTIRQILKINLERSIQAKTSLLNDSEQLGLFEEAVQVVINCYKNGGRLYIAGNGGSAADAQHLAAEFVSKLSKDRGPLPAESLTVDTSIITSIANDYGFGEIFARQVCGKMTKKDVFLGITTSGNSVNIIRALEQCREMQIPTVVFTGMDGGNVKNSANYCIVAPGNLVSTVQELHIILAHALCECVERELFQ